MNKKLKFSLNGIEFQLPFTSYREQPRNGYVEKYIHMNAKNCATIVKQFVKKNYPELKVWSTSDVYSGGSSVRVHVSQANGTEVEASIFDKIHNWKYLLSAGKFNGMTDSYEYNDGNVTTDAGTELKYFPSYVFIENKPKWGTIEYWIKEWYTYKENINNPEYSRLNEMVHKAGSFLEYNKQFMSSTDHQKLTERFKSYPI